MNLPEISKAYELRPGAVYLIQADIHLNKEQAEKITELLDRASESAGCRFLLLEKGLNLVEPPNAG